MFIHLFSFFVFCVCLVSSLIFRVFSLFLYSAFLIPLVIECFLELLVFLYFVSTHLCLFLYFFFFCPFCVAYSISLPPSLPFFFFSLCLSFSLSLSFRFYLIFAGFLSVCFTSSSPFPSLCRPANLFHIIYLHNRKIQNTHKVHTKMQKQWNIPTHAHRCIPRPCT